MSCAGEVLEAMIAGKYDGSLFSVQHELGRVTDESFRMRGAFTHTLGILNLSLTRKVMPHNV